MGAAELAGEPVMSAGRKRTTRIQMVFQDPFASLNPRMRVGDIIAEGPLAHGLITRAEAKGDVARWLAAVGLDAAAAHRFPHQFSGGQRQRVAVARALAMRPDALVCDEPVASLDVSIQAQIINLFLKLRRELHLTMLFISHDLSVVRHVSDRVAIMYLGRIVEIGPTEDDLRRAPSPLHARVARQRAAPRRRRRAGAGHPADSRRASLADSIRHRAARFTSAARSRRIAANGSCRACVHRATCAKRRATFHWRPDNMD